MTCQMKTFFSDKKNKGFTLAELLIVVAIIGILTAVAIPFLNNQVEKSRNAVDMHTAKTIANVITYYFMTNPDALAELTAECDKKGSVHYVQMSVGGEGSISVVGTNTNANIANVLRPALLEAGLIGPYTDSQERFSEITCKSKIKWKGYRIAVTNFSGKLGKPGALQIYYWGVSKDKTVHATNSLEAYQSTSDDNAFKKAMRGE